MKRFLFILFAICFLITSPASAKWNTGQWDYELPSDAKVVAVSGGDYSSIATAVTAASTSSWVTHTFYFTASATTDSVCFSSDFLSGNYELKNFSIAPD